MSTLTRPPTFGDLQPGDGRVVLHGVPWDLYARLRDEAANAHVRMSYFQGTLELMSPQFRHERYGHRLERLVCVLVEELEIPCTCAGSTTFRREDEAAGKEPDACFYLAHEPAIRDKEQIDLAVDPPPDLAIEVDNMTNSEGKLPIYAALGVPEVWRYDALSDELWFGRLQTDGHYHPIVRSECLPMLTPERVLEGLKLCQGQPESRWARLLREWSRALTQAL